MLSELGNLFVLISIILSFSLIVFSTKELKYIRNPISPKIKNFSILQLIFANLCFLVLLLGYLFSDFSMENVYENSHTAKPLLYKISGVWGNHEGSLLLWINVLVLFSFLFFVKNIRTDKKFLLIKQIFQNIIILGFFIFLLTTSNPFNRIFPIPQEGLGLNPILQDPALAIHPPLLYLGFVGSSIYFSAALSSLISKFGGKNFAMVSKPWVLVSWLFQTMGILVGSIWAYYELGWGGYWFWDPVENSSLIPWFLMNALFHSILVLEKRNGIYLWVIVLSILTFTMSVTGTFLVRSGILNSVHTFANDPTRGLYILIFLTAMMLSSIYIFYKYAPTENRSFNFFTKEFSILINNWFMSFFLITVLIGTVYPIFLEVLTSQKISIGPPYYNKVLAPFLIPVLFIMAYGPRTGWISSKPLPIKNILFVLFLSLLTTLIIIYIVNHRDFLTSILLVASVYLILQNLGDFLKNLKNKSQKNYINKSSLISHLGFGLLIFFISLNSIMSIEHDFNIKIGETKKIKNFEVTLEDLKVYDDKNFKKVIGDITILNKNRNTIKRLKPEIRVYDSPETITYEASIKSTIFSDTYVTMSNISRSELYNIKFQKKPFMTLIWFSTILIVIGGFMRVVKKNF
jgi:cytochrome c-type biogenesis protein CcmF